MNAAEFSYQEAFSRNLGWLTAPEQEKLRGKRVAIAGLGGVGGSHLLTLARLGIGKFHIADPDVFEQANFNRQAGAFVSTADRPKIDVLAALAQDINPSLEIRKLAGGVNPANVGDFLEDVDLYVDGLDFFAFDARQTVFEACHQRGVPAVTVAPFGMGAALLNFMPGKMTFEQYFRWNGCSEDEKAIRFLVGLAPALLQRKYLVDARRVDLLARRGPSTAMACDLCAGIAATEALKILLGRGKVIAAPVGAQFDAYRGKYVTTWRPLGNANPLQRLAISVAKRRLGMD